MTDYTRRIVDDELDELLPELPAVAIEGPEAVGKTATAERRAATVHRLHVPEVRSIAAADPLVLLGDPPPVLLDEWQRVPAVWDAVRAAADRDPTPGRFLLAGSAAPMSAPSHSEAGRIVRVRLRPLSLAERGLGEPTISLAALLRGAIANPQGRTSLGLADYAHEIVGSGFPGIRRLSGRALRAQLDGYLERIVDRDFEEQGYAVRRPQALRRWMAAFAAATGTTTSLERIRKAATGGAEEVPAKTTVIAYRNVLERLCILDQVPGWLSTKNRLRRLTQAPKHHLVDPALAARLLGVDAGALLGGIAAGAKLLRIAPADALPRDGTLLGQLFEALVTQSVRVYAQAAEASIYHCRTYDGRQEIDLIVETGDQRVLALEVKMSAEVTDADVRHLLWLRERLGATLTDMAVVTTGKYAYRRQDGVAVIPAVLLGP